MSKARVQLGVPRTDGVVQMNFGQVGDVSGGLGPNPWQFSLTANNETQINPPLPLVYSSNTRWSDYVRSQSDSELVVVDGTYGTRLIEQNVDRQVTQWDFIIDYERSDASTDEQFQIKLLNPITGTDIPASFQFLRGNIVEEGSLIIQTIANSNSVPENGVGSGYQIFSESTTNIDISIRSLTRTSFFESRAGRF